jgi:hypothetical protein
MTLEICDGHDVGNRPLSCINCARALGRKEGEERALLSAPPPPPSAEGLRTLVQHVRHFLGPDWGEPTEPHHQESFLVMAINHLAGSRDSFRAAWEAEEAKRKELESLLGQAEADIHAQGCAGGPMMNTYRLVVLALLASIKADTADIAWIQAAYSVVTIIIWMAVIVEFIRTTWKRKEPR